MTRYSREDGNVGMCVKADYALGSVESSRRIALGLNGAGVSIIKAGRNIETNYGAKLKPYKSVVSSRKVRESIGSFSRAREKFREEAISSKRA